MRSWVWWDSQRLRFPRFDLAHPKILLEWILWYKLMSPGQVTAKSFFHRISQWRGEFSFTNLQVSQNMSNCVYMLSMKLVSALPSRDIAEIDWATWERRSYAPFSLDSQASVHPPLWSRRVPTFNSKPIIKLKFTTPCIWNIK